MTPPPPTLPWLGVVGRPIRHSLSPRLHEAGLQALGKPGASVAVDVGPEYFATVLSALGEAGWVGCNVTAPHKEAALRHAHTATDAARLAGSANCLRRTGEGYEATNTDGAGFLAFLEEKNWRVAGQGVVLLGAGGAAAGLAAALRAVGAELTILARDPKRAASFAGLRDTPVFPLGGPEARARLRAARLVVNATSLGGAPSDPLPCEPDDLGHGTLAVDLRYGPAPSPWLRRVQASERRAYDGLSLLLHQCALSFAFWFGEAPPLTRLREAVPWLASANSEGT